MPGPFPYSALRPNDPPAPVCRLTLSWGNANTPVQALIDSGAGATFIPLRIATNLQLRKIDEAEVTGGIGMPEDRGVYVVNIEFLGVRFTNHPVISLDKEYAIIGRDILNRYIALLHGPNLQYTIT